jgi:valyl-tRNA synthetase
MSKTKGNVIDPLEIWGRSAPTPCGSRLAQMTAQGRDINCRWTGSGYREFVTRLLERGALRADEPEDATGSLPEPGEVDSDPGGLLGG